MADQSLNVYEVARQRQLADEAARQQAAADAAAEYERTRGRTLGEIAGDTGAAALQSAVGLGGAAYGLANLATLGTLDRVTGFSQNLAETQDIVESWKSNPLQARKQEMAAAFKDEGVLSGLGTVVSNPSLLADLGVQSAAYLIPGAAAARAAGGMAAAGAAGRGLSTAAQASLAQKAATKASLVAQAGLSGGYMNADSINAADKAGMSEGEKQLAGIAGGVTGALVNTAITKLTGAGGLEALAANRLGGAALPGVAGGVVTNVAKGVAKEGIEESLQEANEQVIRNAAGNQELGTDVAQNAALGGLLGGTLGGVMGAMSPRQPSVARDEVAKMQRAVERELAGAGMGQFTPSTDITADVAAEGILAAGGTPTDAARILRESPIGSIINTRDPRSTNEIYADALGEQVNVDATPVPQGQMEGPLPLEEIDMAAGMPPELPQVQELSGLRAILAARQARMASQPPRPQVVEQGIEEVTIDALPQPAVQTRNLDDVYRETAPIGGVAQRFGIEVAAQEAARRAALTPATTIEQSAPAARQPIDMADELTKKKYQSQIDQALRAAGVPVSRRGKQNVAELDTIVADLAAAGVRPTDPDFAQAVGVAAERTAAKQGRDTAGVSSLIAEKFPLSEEQRANIRAGIEFDQMVQEDVAAPASAKVVAAPTPVPVAAPAARPTIPAELVETVERGQTWVNSSGVEYEVRTKIGNEWHLYPVGKNTGVRRQSRAALNKNGWQMVGELPPAAPRQAPAQPNPETLLSFLSKRGGINLDEQLTTLGDTGKQANKGYREGNLFRKGGDGMDSIAIAMHEAGYLTDAEFSDVDGGVQAARDKIAAAFAGEKIYAMESEAYQKQLADQAAVSPDLNGPAYDAYVAQPGAPLMQTAVEQQAAHGSLMPVFDGAVAAVDLAESVEEAGNAVRAARVHPAYLQMTEAQQLQYEAHFAAVLQSLANAKFHLAGAMPSGTGVDAAAFNAMATRAKQTLGVDVLTHEDAAAAAAAIGMEVPTNAAGFFYNGAIHLIRANNATKKDLEFTIAHEAGHLGMDKLLGASLDAAMNRMWANAEMRKRIKTAMVANPGMTRQIAAEEVLADMLAAGEKINSSVMAKLYNGVRNFFASLVGIRDLVVTNQEIDRLLSDVALVNKGHVPQHVVPGGMDFDLWVNNTASAATQNPKFSKARYDMDAMLQAAANEQERPDNVLAFSGAAKAVQTAAGDTVKSVWSALKERKLGEMYMHNFMSLDHLVDHYDTLFGGRIKKYARLREQKEAQFNRLNARENELVYKTIVNGKEVENKLGNQSVNELTKEWDGYKRANPAKAVSLDYVLSEGTYYQIFPERSWEDQIHSGFDYEGKGYNEAERRAAYDKISAAWNTLGEQGKRIYMKSQAVYGTRHAEHYQAIVSEAERRGARAAEQARARGGDGDVVAARIEAAVKRYKQQMATMMGKMKQGPYSPLQRFGDYFVVVQNDKGETVHLSAYDNRADQEAAAKEIAEARKKANENVVVSTTMTKDQAFDATGVPKDQIESIRREVIDMLPDTMDADARAAAVESLTSGLAEMYLQSLPAKSFAKHSIQRKNIAGYDDNALRAFANYTIRSARSVAGIQYDGQIANALTDVQNYVDDTRQGKYSTAEGVKEIDTNKLQNVANAVKNQYKQSQNLTQNKIADTLTAAAFTYQLTSPSQMFMNATQVMFVTFPELAAKYGAKQAAAELNRAAKQYFQSGFDLLSADKGKDGKQKAVLRTSADPADSALLQALTRIKENGPLDITQAHDVSGVADGSAGQLSPYWGKTMKVLSLAMHKSEVFNRQITAAAAIRMEMGKMAAEGKKLLDADGKLTAEAEARLVGIGQDTITSTQFNYAQYAKPPVMQGPVGKVVMQYKMYQLAMLSLLSRNIKSAELGKLLTGKEAINKEDAKIARETLSWMLGMQVALTGTAGTIIAPFAFALADMFKDDDDLTSSKQDYVNAVGKYVAHGVLAGLIDTSRIEAATLIPILGQRDYAPVEGRPADTFTYYVAQNLGPSFGLTRNLYTGVSELGNGNYEKAVQLLLPKPFADVHASVFDGANGVRNSKDIIYYEPSPFDTALNFVGLRSGERREAELRRQTFNAVQTRQFAVRDRYLGRLALAYQGGDGGEIQDAMADIQSWNQRYPDMPIVGQEMRKAIVSRFRTQSVASQTGLPTSRMPGESLADMVGQW